MWGSGLGCLRAAGDQPSSARFLPPSTRMSSRRGLAGLILDVDGTLIDSNDLHARAWREAFREHGKRIPLDEIRKHIGKGGDLLIPDLLDAAEMRAIGKKVGRYRSKLFKRDYLPRVRPFPRIRESLEQLREKGIRLLLASSSPPEEVEVYVELCGIGDLIEGFTSAEDAEFSKPSPEIFEAALEKISAPRSRTAIVGDTPYDILAAHRTATPVAAVRSGGFSDDSLDRAEWLFDDVRQLVRRIRSIDDYFHR